MSDYQHFLTQKQVTAPPAGFTVPTTALHPALFPFQRHLVAWALQRGQAALFEECGLGKTLQQLEWARHVCAHTGGSVLILAPLAVAEQTVAEGAKFGIPVTLCAQQTDVDADGINITNYEKLHLFTPGSFQGVVIDESSILKAYMGKTKQALLRAFAATPYKLACTATPSPNDTTELGNHAEFLGVMEAGEMLTRWFINDTKQAQNLRLKAHGAADFWRWVTIWAACVSRPSDLIDPATGQPYSDAGYELPPLQIQEHTVAVDWTQGADDHLFRLPTLSATEVHREHRLTTRDRAARAAALVRAEPDEPWVLWCYTNAEADALRALLPEAVEVRGSESDTEKSRKLRAFTAGDVRYIITKPSIAGWGLNWQHCARLLFVGRDYSFEQEYQALRRVYRFGQTRPVVAHIIGAETEGAVAQVVQRKREEHRTMQEKMIAALRETQLGATGPAPVTLEPGILDEQSGDGWTMYLGDCVDVTRTLPSDSIHFSIWSPPFSSLYTYTPSLRDMGNCEDDAAFFEHFAYLIPELWRVLVPGRLVAVHCKNLPMYKSRYGASGIRDFRGAVIRAFEDAEIPDGGRWVYHSEVCIWTDPVDERARTNAQRLLYKQVRQDASHSGQGLAEYLVIFRKWTADGAAPIPITHTKESFPLALWQRYASPVWFDIQRTDVLNARIARENQDEKHLCPLQLGVIERAIELWSNPGETVLSCFAGIGSELYQALKMGRQAVGIELKPAYYSWACRNAELAVTEREIPNFLDLFTAEAQNA